MLLAEDRRPRGNWLPSNPSRPRFKYRAVYEFKPGDRVSVYETGRPILFLHRPIRLPAPFNRQMAHRRVAGSPMPVPHPFRDNDHVTGGNGAFLRFRGHEPLPFENLQYLVLVVTVWLCTCTRAETDVHDVKLVAVCGADEDLELDLAVKVVGARWLVLGLSSIDSDDLHRSFLPIFYSLKN